MKINDGNELNEKSSIYHSTQGLLYNEAGVYGPVTTKNITPENSGRKKVRKKPKRSTSNKIHPKPSTILNKHEESASDNEDQSQENEKS